MSKSQEFLFSESSEPHHDRTKLILAEHPEIRNLIGHNPYSFLIVFGVVSLQLFLAFLSSQLAWWLVIVLAYLVGAFCNHSLFVLIHDASHDLIFKRRNANLWAMIIADIPNVLPGAVSFRRYHLKHHSFQGIYELDADLPSRWEARLVGNSALGKALWMLLFPVFQLLRPPRLKEIKLFSIWTWISIAVIGATNVLIYLWWGPNALLYLTLSLVFGVGLHPLGARWIQEHYIISPPQETYSYYGPLNLIALNVGYHNEHHDFPSVPWNRLPSIRAMAPEYYDSLVYHRSWLRLLFKFIFDSKISLFSRVQREDRGGRPLEAQVGLLDEATGHR